MPRLSTAVLPDGLADGYFVNADGSYSFFTRHLTTFGLMRVQAPLVLTTSQTELKVGQTATLSVSGGTGTGVLAFKSIDSAICSVTAAGVVAGSTIGNCLITVSKMGSGSYLDVTSARTTILISWPEPSVSVSTSLITVKRLAGITTLKVNLGRRYANKLIRLEWGLQKEGNVFYGSWGNSRANAQGIATLPTTKVITPKTYVRAVIGSTVLAKRGITTAP